MKKERQTIINRQIPSEILVKIVYIITSIVFAIPSLNYLIVNKNINKFGYMFSMFFPRRFTAIENYINVTIYIIIFSILFLLYFYILKNVNKVFKNNKSLFTFITVVRNIIYGYDTNN